MSTGDVRRPPRKRRGYGRRRRRRRGRRRDAPDATGPEGGRQGLRPGPAKPTRRPKAGGSRSSGRPRRQGAARGRRRRPGPQAGHAGQGQPGPQLGPDRDVRRRRPARRRHHRLRRVRADLPGRPAAWEERAAGIDGIDELPRAPTPTGSSSARGQPQGRRPDVHEQPAGRRRAQRRLAELHGRRLQRADRQRARRAQPGARRGLGDLPARTCPQDQVDELAEQGPGKRATC